MIRHDNYPSGIRVFTNITNHNNCKKLFICPNNLQLKSLKFHYKMPPPQSKAWSYCKRDVEWETLETKLEDIPLHLFKKQNVNDKKIALKKPNVQRSLDFLLCDEPDDPYEET